MTTCIALLRGINVGRANRLAMADLRRVLGSLGCSNVQTLLNSGNAVFEVPRPNPKKLSAAITQAIECLAGITIEVVVLTQSQFTQIIESNSLVNQATDPAKHLVGFVSAPNKLELLTSVSGSSWHPEAIDIGEKAVYLWCPAGVIDSKLMKAITRISGGGLTTRNWTTVLKINALASNAA